MKRRKNMGFTLIELLIVISVIAILIGIVLPRFRGLQEEGLIAHAKAELRTLQTAVESYYVHNNNTYPSSLSSLTSASPNIIGSALPTDPFNPGSNYGYDRGGTNNQYYVIYSVGPNGNGSAQITRSNTVSETNGSSCIYISNADRDATP